MVRATDFVGVGGQAGFAVGDDRVFVSGVAMV